MSKETIFTTEAEITREVKRFRRYLRKENSSINTVNSYCWTLNYFLSTYRHITTDTILAYKAYLIEYFSPQTANQRMQAMNKYFNWNGLKFHMKAVKIQRRQFLENVISMPDYKFLKRKLKKEDDLIWYFMVWGIASTGARPSELVKFKVEHIKIGYTDIYGKGVKVRRIYFTKQFQKETLKWLESIDRTEGYIYLNKDGNVMTVKGLDKQLKHFAVKYGLNKEVMYSYSFRHFYGKSFCEKYMDLPLLADLMGHSSIETTRIYTRRTSAEQHAIVCRVVTW